MPHPHARTDTACRNCGTPAPLEFCPACGQETAMHPPTLGEFVHEFVGHYVALEGALWRTLAMLLRHPGRLTREYLDGRRRRYVLPLRLYLTASFLFFVVFKLTPSAIDQATVMDAAARPDAAANAGLAASAPPFEILRPVDCGRAGESPCDALERFVNGVGQRFGSDPRGMLKQTSTRLIGAAPYAIFLLLPVFAGLVALAWRSRRMSYGEHVVFSLHLHAFWFLLLLVAVLVPSAVAEVLLWLLPAYGVWAAREVYRGGWGGTLLRAAGVGIAYALLLLLTTLGLLVGLLATG